MMKKKKKIVHVLPKVYSTSTILKLQIANTFNVQGRKQPISWKPNCCSVGYYVNCDVVMPDQCCFCSIEQSA